MTEGSSSGETIKALGGNDQVFAAEGNDTVYGSSGNDNVLVGQGGSDTFSGSTDHSYGGDGNDTILAADSSLDIINCGKGTADEVRYDDKPTVKDMVKGCENKVPVA